MNLNERDSLDYARNFVPSGCEIKECDFYYDECDNEEYIEDSINGKILYVNEYSTAHNLVVLYIKEGEEKWSKDFCVGSMEDDDYITPNNTSKEIDRIEDEAYEFYDGVDV